MEIKKTELIFASNNVAEAIKFHEEYFKGKIVHKMTGLFDETDTFYVMEYPSGERGNFFESSKFEKGTYAVRINVDNLDEVLSAYLKNGFTLRNEPKENPSVKAAVVMSHDGNVVILMEHLKH